MNGPEQATMSKVIEKKQVGILLNQVSSAGLRLIPWNRCKTSCGCTLSSWRNASMLVLKTLHPKL